MHPVITPSPPMKPPVVSPVVLFILHDKPTLSCRTTSKHLVEHPVEPPTDSYGVTL